MKFKHPCKYCIVKPICDKECSILNDYIDQFDTIRLVYSILALASLLLILSYILLYYITMWSLVSIPFIWPVAFIVYRYYRNKSDNSLNTNGIYENILVVIFLPVLMILAGIFYFWNKYVTKYSPEKF